jgi:hypothetical protein
MVKSEWQHSVWVPLLESHSRASHSSFYTWHLFLVLIYVTIPEQINLISTVTCLKQSKLISLLLFWRKRSSGKRFIAWVSVLVRFYSFFSFSDYYYWSTLAEAADLRHLLFPCHDMRQISRNLFQTQEIRSNGISTALPKNSTVCAATIRAGT